LFVLGGLCAGVAKAQPPDQPVSDPQVECEVLIDADTSIIPGMPPFAVIGLNLVEGNADFTDSRLYQIDVVIMTDLVNLAPGDLDNPAVRNWFAERLPEIEIWADGQPQGDEQNGSFTYTIPQGRPANADRPLRGTQPPGNPNPEVVGPNPQDGGMYILPRDPATCNDPNFCDPNVDAIFRVLQGTGLSPLIYRFTFTAQQRPGNATWLNPDDGQQSGNDLFVVVRLSSLWPTGASLLAGMWGQIDANPPIIPCLLYTSPSPRDATLSRMPSSA